MNVRVAALLATAAVLEAEVLRFAIKKAILRGCGVELARRGYL